MKNVFAGLVLVLLAVGMAYGASTPDSRSVEGAYQVMCDTTLIATHASKDSLYGVGDTDVVVSYFKPKPGLDYYLVTDTLLGHADSTVYGLYIRARGPKGAVLMTYTDTSGIATNAPRQLWLPFGSKVIGSSYDVIIMTGTNNSGYGWYLQHAYLYARKAIQQMNRF